MPEPGPESTERSAAALWRTLVPSLAVLSGIFFFINAACMSDSSGDEYPGQYGSVEPPGCTASGITPPANASATILEPTADQELSGASAGGPVEVSVKLQASGIQISPPAGCVPGSGHFMLAVQRVADGACAVQVLPVELFDGSSETTLRLWPGTYLLTVQVLNANSLAFQPAVSDDVRFVVAGDAPRQDGGVCP